MTAHNTSFARTVAMSFLYSGLGEGLSKLVSFGALLVVLKLISAADLGLVTSVMAIVAILQSITELGLGAALVQRKDLTPKQIDSLFWLATLLSGAVYGVIALGAPLIAWFYEEPRLIPLLRVHGSVVLLANLYLVPRSLLTRDLRFGKLAIGTNASLLLSSAVMVLLAYEGYGPWAIVGGEVTTRLVEMLFVFGFRPYRPRLVLRLAEIRDMVKFGLYATGSRLLYNFYVNADYLVVSKVFGWQVVGIYALAYRVVSDPVRTLVSITNQVAYPAFAKLQSEPSRLVAYFFNIARANLLLSGTVLVLVAVLFPFALVIGGYHQYDQAVFLVYVMALAGVVRCVAPLVPQLLNAVGRAQQNFFYSLAMATVMPAAFFVGSTFGIHGVAWAWALAYPALSSLLFFFGSRAVGLSLPRFVAGAFSGIALLLTIAATAIAARLALSPLADGSPIAATVLVLLVTLAVAVGLIYRFERHRLTEVFTKKAKDTAAS